jgi:hypothetical protein
MKRKQIEQGKGPLDLIEEAVHLLRRAPAATLLTYYLGSLPFVLGLLYFWADMSRSSFAERRLPLAAFGMTMLFLWMKCWQAVFARRMRAQVSGETVPQMGRREWGRLVCLQALVQPTGLILLPVALVFLFPFGYVYAFYQNVTALPTDESPGLRQAVKRARQQAVLRPGQNHYGLLALKAFGLFVFLDLAAGFVAVPFLLKTLLGIDTVFSRSWMAIFNTTFLATIAALTYLCLDPLAKTFYVLRCFYGEALQSGQDLRAELRVLAADSRAAALLVFLALGCSSVSWGQESSAQEPPASTAASESAVGAGRGAGPTETPRALSAPALDETIRQVIGKREYLWRLPRETVPQEDRDKGALAAFLDQVIVILREWTRTVGEWLDKLGRWIFGNTPRPSARSSTNWLAGLRWLLVALIVALAAVLGVMLVRIWRRRTRNTETLAQPLPAMPDLADDHVSPDQLPEDGWSRLARELMDRGELRLALRAYYLASLAHLADRNLIRLAKFKSNRDYAWEVSRRAHALPAVAEPFTENVSIFDRVWYGLHEVSHDLLEQFARNVQRIKTSLG